MLVEITFKYVKNEVCVETTSVSSECLAEDLCGEKPVETGNPKTYQLHVPVCFQVGELFIPAYAKRLSKGMLPCSDKNVGVTCLF